MTRLSSLLAAALLAGAAVPAVAQEAAPAAAKSLSVVLLQARMDPPVDSLPADQRAMLADWKFADIERLIPERAPAVLQANGFAGDAVVVPGQDGAPDLAQLLPDRALLVLRVHDVAQTHPRFFVTAGAVHVEVSFYPAGNGGGARTPSCHGLSGGTLGFDPVWGIAKTVRVDAKWVDGIVAGALDLAAKQGCVTLDGARVVFPKG